MDIKSLMEKRGKAIADARAILDKADAEKRALSGEEQTTYDKLIADATGLKDTITRAEQQRELDREMAETRAANELAGAAAGRETAAGAGADPAMGAFRNFLVVGRAGLSADELRALSAGVDASGGYTIPPEQFVSMLIKAVDDLVFIRQRATKMTVGQAASLGVPTLDADPADADWTVELATGSEDSTMAFGKRSLSPHPLAKLLKVSEALLRTSPLSIEALVLQRLAYKFAISEEKAFLTGSGSGQPLGLFTASNDGIPTSRDVSTGNTTTSITFDGLIEAKFSLKGQYWGRSDWLFHRDALKQITKLKDGEGQYLWRESVRVGEPDMLLGRPFMMSEYVPNTFTTGLYVGLLGDFSNYWIADALSMRMQRLAELYAATNQVGFIGRLECDGMPVLAEAFARVKLG